jgi:hypothetical protein
MNPDFNQCNQCIRYLCSSVFICGSSCFAAPPEPKFRHQSIDDKIEIGYGVAAADVDGDEKIDILLADKKQFAWYRNPTWQKFVIAENLTKRDNVCLAAQDIDGDGKCELAVGGDWDPNDRENSGAVFYMIAPEDRTQKWEAVKLHAEPTVHRMRWRAGGQGQWTLLVVPLHGKGPDRNAPSRVLAYHKPADARREWNVSEVLTGEMHATHNLDVGGPFNHILIAGREGIRPVHPGTDVAPPRMNEHPAGEVRMGSKPFHFVTIEPMHGSSVVAYVQDAEPPRRMVVSEKLVEGHALAYRDVLDAGQDQIIAGWRGGRGGVALWTPLDARLTTWRQTDIDIGGMACEDLCLADVNADGKLDVIASGRATKNVKVYWNETGK